MFSPGLRGNLRGAAAFPGDRIEGANDKKDEPTHVCDRDDIRDGLATLCRDAFELRTRRRPDASRPSALEYPVARARDDFHSRRTDLVSPKQLRRERTDFRFARRAHRLDIKPARPAYVRLVHRSPSFAGAQSDRLEAQRRSAELSGLDP